MNKYFYYVVLSTLLCCGVAAEQVIKMEWNVRIANVTSNTLCAHPSPVFGSNTYYFINGKHPFLVSNVYAIDTARKQLKWSGFPGARALHFFPQHDMLVVIGDSYVSGVRASTNGTVVWSGGLTHVCDASSGFPIQPNQTYKGIIVLSLMIGVVGDCVLTWLHVATGQVVHTQRNIGTLYGVSGDTVVTTKDSDWEYHRIDAATSVVKRKASAKGVSGNTVVAASWSDTWNYNRVYGVDIVSRVVKWKIAATAVLGMANGKALIGNISASTFNYNIALVDIHDGTITKVIAGLRFGVLPMVYIQNRNKAEAYLFHKLLLAKIDLNRDVLVWKRSAYGPGMLGNKITAVVKCGSSVLVSFKSFFTLTATIIALDDLDGRIKWKIDDTPTTADYKFLCLGSSVFVPNLMGYIAYSLTSQKVVARSVNGSGVYAPAFLATSAGRFVTQQPDGSVSGYRVV